LPPHTCLVKTTRFTIVLNQQAKKAKYKLNIFLKHQEPSTPSSSEQPAPSKAAIQGLHSIALKREMAWMPNIYRKSKLTSHQVSNKTFETVDEASDAISINFDAIRITC
jgi:hypothetical protein